MHKHRPELASKLVRVISLLLSCFYANVNVPTLSNAHVLKEIPSNFELLLWHKGCAISSAWNRHQGIKVIFLDQRIVI